MTSSETMWLPREQARDIHARLLMDDPVAPSELAEAFLDLLVGWLQAHNRGIDPHICATAAEDAILALIKNPQSYNPDRQSVEAYLRMSAKGDLKNALRAESRHRLRRADLSAVELSTVGRKSLWEHTDPALVVERRADEEVVEEALAPAPVLESVRARLTSQEARVLELMREGERRTEVYSEALGIRHLPLPSQRAEVKRTKDRLKRRLERSGRRDG